MAYYHLWIESSYEMLFSLDSPFLYKVLTPLLNFKENKYWMLILLPAPPFPMVSGGVLGQRSVILLLQRLFSWQILLASYWWLCSLMSPITPRYWSHGLSCERPCEDIYLRTYIFLSSLCKNHSFIFFFFPLENCWNEFFTATVL